MDVIQTFAEYGLPGLIILAMFAGIAIAAKWLATNAIVPVVKACIAYMEQQAEATIRNVESLESLSRLEQEIRRSLLDIEAQQRNPNSAFSTVHTNTSIRILARAISRIAKACNVDATELVDEIETVLKGERT